MNQDEMLKTLYEEEKMLQQEYIKTQQTLKNIVVNLHRTQGAIQVLEKLKIPTVLLNEEN